MKLGLGMPAPTKRPNRIKAFMRQIRSVYPSQQEWDELLRSIEEKAEIAHAITNRVSEQQARLRL